MKLYIRFGSLDRFHRLYDASDFLIKVLSKKRSNVYFIEADYQTEISNLLKNRNVKFDISDK